MARRRKKNTDGDLKPSPESGSQAVSRRRRHQGPGTSGRPTTDSTCTIEETGNRRVTSEKSVSARSRSRRRRQDAHAGKKAGDIISAGVNKLGEQPDPDPTWRFLYVLSSERDAYPNLEAALRLRTNKAQKNTLPSGIPVYRVPVSEMPKFEVWNSRLPPAGYKPTMEGRFIELHRDVYKRAVVFMLYDLFHYMYKDRPWEKLGGAAPTKAPADVAKSTSRRRRRK